MGYVFVSHYKYVIIYGLCYLSLCSFLYIPYEYLMFVVTNVCFSHFDVVDRSYTDEDLLMIC